MKKRKLWVVTNYKKILLYCAGIAGALILLGLNLSGLTGGKASASEVLYGSSTMSLSRIAENPVNLPLGFIHWLANQLSSTSLSLARLPSVLFAVLAIGAMVYVLRRWYGPRTALFGYFLFLTAAWLLHSGRLATPDILLVWAVPTLLAANILLQDYAKKTAVPYVWLFLVCAVLYVPGMLWFVLISLWLQREIIINAIKSIRIWWNKLLLGTFGALLIAPLGAGLIVGDAKSVVFGLLGLPEQLLSLPEIAKNILDTVLFIGVRGTAPDDLWLNHLPLLSAFLLVGFVAGMYFYAKHWRANRAKLLGSYLLVGIVLVSLGGAVNVGLILPVLYLIVAAGIAYLLHLWLVVFPKNPIARATGIGLVAIAVAVTCIFSIRQYFVAWPHHRESSAKFQKHI